MANKILIQIATLFSIGKFPKAPGTVATLATIPIWYVLSFLNPMLYMLLVLGLIGLGIVASQAYEAHSGKHDSKEIVIDEVVGYLIAMVWLPVTWQSAVLGFIVFRFFDIVKPPPIRQLDKKVEGGFGVMVDDIVAGIFSSIIMQLLYNQTNWLGSQISLLTTK